MSKIREKNKSGEMDWYVLFVKVGYEKKVLDQLEMYFDKDQIIPFIPKLEVFHKYKNDNIKKEKRIMFPGYVFIETVLEKTVFVGMIKKFIIYHEAPLRLLKYGDSNEFAMRKYEKSLLQSFCNKDFCFEASTGLIQGTKTIVICGPLKGRESMIRKIDRSRRKAIIEMDFMGNRVSVTVGLDILRKQS